MPILMDDWTKFNFMQAVDLRRVNVEEDDWGILKER